MTRSSRLFLGITAAISLTAACVVSARANPAAATAGDVVLLNFSASWCGPCRQMAPLVGEITAAGWVVRHVDVDREGDLVRRFGVTGVPCYVLLVKGQEAGRINGATTRGELEGLLSKSRQPLGLAPMAALPAAAPMAGIPLPIESAATPLSTEPPAAPQSTSAAIVTAGPPPAVRQPERLASPTPRRPAAASAADSGMTVCHSTPPSGLRSSGGSWPPRRGCSWRIPKGCLGAPVP
jgi:thiol-disulfide isomerase/thioredoxin